MDPTLMCIYVNVKIVYYPGSGDHAWNRNAIGSILWLNECSRSVHEGKPLLVFLYLLNLNVAVLCSAVFLWIWGDIYEERSDGNVPFNVWFSIHECLTGTIESFHLAFSSDRGSFSRGFRHTHTHTHTLTLTYTAHSVASHSLFA